MAKKPANTKGEPKPESRAVSRRPDPPAAHRWKPGQSGNPGGQPKGLADVRRHARTFTAEAIDRLAYWMRSEEARASIAAAVAILNRGWGMPQQNINATISDIRAMSDAELTEYLIADEGGNSPRALAPPADTGKPH